MLKDLNDSDLFDSLPKSETGEEIFPVFTNENEIKSTLLSMPRLVAITVDKLLFARRDANKAQRNLREYEARLYHDYKTNKERRWTKDEILILYPNDVTWSKLRKELDFYLAKVEYYENRLKMLKETSWLLRTYVDFQFYLSGEGKRPRVI